MVRACEASRSSSPPLSYRQYPIRLAPLATFPTRGRLCPSEIPLSSPNLRPFGAPPSIGRRECPREPLPLEGAVERSEAGLASFLAAKPLPLCLPHRGRLCFGIAVFTKYGKPVNLLTYEDTHRVLSPRSHHTRRWMEQTIKKEIPFLRFPFLIQVRLRELTN